MLLMISVLSPELELHLLIFNLRNVLINFIASSFGVFTMNVTLFFEQMFLHVELLEDLISISLFFIVSTSNLNGISNEN